MSDAHDEADESLAGRVVAIAETRQLDVLAGLLERRGAVVRRCPLVGIKDTPDAAGVSAWLDRRISGHDDLFVAYTGEGIERLLAFARRLGLEAPLVDYFARTPKLTRGPKPKRALRRLGLETEHEAEAPTTAGLVATAAALPLAQAARVAIQLYGSNQDLGLVEHFNARGIDADCVAPYVYASSAEDGEVLTLVRDLDAGRIDAIAFTSKAQVERLWRVAAEHGLSGTLVAGLERTRVAAVGPVVRDVLAAAGVRVDAMPEQSYFMKPLVTSLCALLAPPR